MRIHVASDHAGFELKTAVVEHLSAAGHEVVDHGAHTYDPQDDYPSVCFAAGEAVVADPGSLGVVIGGSGNGEAIAANKVKGVRAALVWSDATATLAREHNDANVISIGARQHDMDTATRFVKLFIETAYSGEPRHTRRIEMLGDYERTGQLPPLPGEG